MSMKIQKKFFIKFTPIQFLLIGFVFIILLGSILLALPISSSTNVHQSFINALFTSTSAVTTTGLVVVDTGSYYSVFGQIVILLLIQVGFRLHDFYCFNCFGFRRQTIS